jgi:hypothetical protein
MDYRNKTKKVDLFGNLNGNTTLQRRTKKRPIDMEGGGIRSFFEYYFWLAPKMRRFKRFEKTFNKTNELLKKEFAAYDAETKKIKKFAEQKLDNLNNWLVASKVEVIVNEFYVGEIKEKDDKKEAGLKRKVQAMLKTMIFKREEYLKKIKIIDKHMGPTSKDAKEYSKMTKEFGKKINKYEKSLEEHSRLVEFKEEIKLLNEKFKIYTESDKGGKEGLRPIQKEVINTYKKRKSSYDRVIAFTDGYMEKTTQFVTKLTSLRREGEFYNNILTNPKLSPSGKNKGNFEDWRRKIQDFYRDLLVAYKSGGDYKKKFEEIKSKMANVGGRLSTIGTDSSAGKLKNVSEIVKLLDQCIKHQDDINSLVSQLRINFSNNQPAIRLQYDSQLILSKIILLRRMMDTIKGLMKKTFPKILKK